MNHYIMQYEVRHTIKANSATYPKPIIEGVYPKKNQQNGRTTENKCEQVVQFKETICVRMMRFMNFP